MILIYRYFLTLSLVFFISSILNAQPIERVINKKSVVYIEELLSISKAQAEEVIIAMNYNKQPIVNAIMDKNMSNDKKRAILKALHLERQKKLKAVLTAEQLSKLTSTLQKRHADNALKQMLDKHDTDNNKKIKGGRLKEQKIVKRTNK